MRKWSMILMFACGVVWALSSHAFSSSGRINSAQSKTNNASSSAVSYDNILVSRAIDGDTLELENGKRLRLIGIDTPEMHQSAKLFRDSQRSKKDIATIQAMGRESYQFTKSLVEGKRVRIEFDVEKQDHYKRMLGYVFLQDGTFVNDEIVKQGYASVMTIPPNVKYSDMFVNSFRSARENRKGLWK